MAAAITPLDGVYDEIKRHVPMVALLGHYGIKAKVGMKIGCPWHPGENTPSCHVYADHVHSYDCGRSGDIFDVAEALSGRPHAEVLQELARMAHVDLPRLSAAQRERQQRRTSVRGLVELVTQNLHTRLAEQRSKGAQTVRRWLSQKRGILLRTAIETKLGIAEGWSSAATLIGEHGGQPALQLAQQAGILRMRKREAGPSALGYYDHMHHSLILPVRWAGKAQSFIGRTKVGLLEGDERKAKTLKLPGPSEETPDALPAPMLWWPAGCRDGRQAVIVVEGEIDALTVYQLGFQAVALLSASAASDRAAAMEIAGGSASATADKIYMIPDADRAGRDAAMALARHLGKRLHIVQPEAWTARGFKDPNAAMMGYLGERLPPSEADHEVPQATIDLAIEQTMSQLREELDEAISRAEAWHIWETKQICHGPAASTLGPEDIAHLVCSRVAPVVGLFEGRAVREAALSTISSISGIRATTLNYEAKTGAAELRKEAELRLIYGGGEASAHIRTASASSGGQGGSGAGSGSGSGSGGGASGARKEVLVLSHELEAASRTVLGWMSAQPRDEHAIYQRGRELVRIVPAQTVAHVGDESTGVELEKLTPASLREHIHARADIRLRKGDEISADNVPLALCEYILAKPAWPMLGQITQVYRCPILDTEGNVVLESGYHEGLGAWVDLGTLKVPEVPAQPTDADIDTALRWLEELLCDFPFKGQSDRANAIGLALLPFVRPLIRGVAAPHFITAATEGTGKTLLAHTLSQVATGMDSPSMTQCANDEEWEKRLGAALRRSPATLLIDNVGNKQRLDSGVLASWMTSRHPEFRELGQSNMVRVRNDAAWVLTGNNPQTSTELARRMVWIRMVANDERPSEREGFRHSLPRWGLVNRAMLCWAFLVLARAWFVAGQPGPEEGVRLGSFDEHVRVVGGVLHHAGIWGYLSNRDEHYQAVTQENEEWRKLFENWYSEVGQQPIPVKRVVELAISSAVLEGALGDGSERSQRIRMGKALSSRVDRVVRLSSGLGEGRQVRLVRSLNGHTKAQEYKLQWLEPEQVSWTTRAAALGEPAAAAAAQEEVADSGADSADSCGNAKNGTIRKKSEAESMGYDPCGMSGSCSTQKISEKISPASSSELPPGTNDIPHYPQLSANHDGQREVASAQLSANPDLHSPHYPQPHSVNPPPAGDLLSSYSNPNSYEYEGDNKESPQDKEEPSNHELKQGAKPPRLAQAPPSPQQGLDDELWHDAGGGES